jgi:fused signal recognition particle receptor
MTTIAMTRRNSDCNGVPKSKKSVALQTLVLAIALAALPSTNMKVEAFAPRQTNVVPTRSSSSRIQTNSKATTTTTELSMVFDFFKQRSEEGIEQLSKLTDAASKGNLGKGLADAAEYTQVSNEAFADGLAKSRNRFLNNLDGLFGASKADTLEELLEDLQDVLLQADLGVSTSEEIVNEVRYLSENKSNTDKESGKKPELLSREDLMSVMRGVLLETLDFESNNDESEGDDEATTTEPPSLSLNSITGASAIRFASKESKIPTVLFVMGANGMGKTTTIGKLANRLRVEGNQKVLVAACDTFRAGAVEQLQMWADRAEVDLLGPSPNGTSTPTSIAAEACQKAMDEGYDTVLIDTAGRLSNNWELNEELVRMKTAIQETLGDGSDSGNEGGKNLNLDVPHEALLVLDAAQGRMALDSAQIWNKEIGLTGLILTKLDGTARGGSVVAISKDLNLPVKLIGVGEGIDDLRDVSSFYYFASFMVEIKFVVAIIGLHDYQIIRTFGRFPRSIFSCFVSFCFVLYAFVISIQKIKTNSSKEKNLSTAYWASGRPGVSPRAPRAPNLRPGWKPSERNGPSARLWCPSRAAARRLPMRRTTRKPSTTPPHRVLPPLETSEARGGVGERKAKKASDRENDRPICE